MGSVSFDRIADRYDETRGGPPPDRPHLMIDAAGRVDLHLVTHVKTRSAVWSQSPEDLARTIETRTWSSLWDLPDDRWSAIVEPAVAALRALPDPHRPRERRSRYELLVFERP
jgi:hypothetical protein